MAKGLKGLYAWIACFKTGKHPGSGPLADHTFTDADLDQMIANLSADNPVPHVITHDSLYMPTAYAHGVEAKREGDTLYIRSEKIEPQFEALVESGALFSRSIQVLKDATRGWCLDHIAWLGAEPPAVHGLEPVKFNLKAANAASFEYVDTQTPYTLKRLARSIREFLVDKFDVATADQVVPEYSIEDMDWAAKRAEKAEAAIYEDDPLTHFTKAPSGGDVLKTPEQIEQEKQDAIAADRKVQQAKFDKEMKDQKAAFAATEMLRRKEDWGVKVNALVGSGQLTPAQAEGMAEFASSLPTDETAVVSFSRKGAEGKADQEVKVSPADWFASFAASLPKQVAIGSQARGAGADDDEQVDTDDAQAIADRATKYMKAQSDLGVTVTLTEAVYHVTNKTD